jgi:hypothetical protein
MMTLAICNRMPWRIDGRVDIPAGVGLWFDTNVPEPSTWAMLIAGLGTVGTAIRRRVAVAA